MHRFELLEPRSLNEACAAIAADTEARPIAGGTALLTILKHGRLAPTTLINLKKIADGSDISFDPALGLRIGALATIHQIESSPLVRKHYPLLAEACHVVANIRIRHMATIGGNLAHADYQSDPPTALAVLAATIEIAGRHGTRTLTLGEFQRGVYETALGPGDLITALYIPPIARGVKGSYIKFTTGSSEERPCAGVAMLARMENRTCRELRIAIGAVSPTVIRIGAAEEMAGREFSSEWSERIAVEAARSVNPIDDVRGSAEYKRHLVRVLVRRALECLEDPSKESAS